LGFGGTLPDPAMATRRCARRREHPRRSCCCGAGAAAAARRRSARRERWEEARDDGAAILNQIPASRAPVVWLVGEGGRVSASSDDARSRQPPTSWGGGRTGREGGGRGGESDPCGQGFVWPPRRQPYRATDRVPRAVDSATYTRPTAGDDDAGGPGRTRRATGHRLGSSPRRVTIHGSQCTR
jgi:hypothetical protein